MRENGGMETVTVINDQLNDALKVIGAFAPL